MTAVWSFTWYYMIYLFLIDRGPEDFRPEAAKFDLSKIVREVLQKPDRMRGFAGRPPRVGSPLKRSSIPIDGRTRTK